MRRRVLIFRPGLSDEEIAQLKKLLTDSGCPETELADSIGEYVEPAKAETVIFLLTAARLADPEIHKAICGTAGVGRRAVCVWPQGCADVGLPKDCVDLSYSIASWSREKLGDVLRKDDCFVSEGPDGVPLPREPDDHLECVTRAP